jgi:hypothetical protein
LAYFGESGGLARDVESRHHPYHGIQVSDQAGPLVEGCRCEQNQLFGTACFGASQEVLRHNVASDNEQGGYYLGDRAQTMVLSNQAHQSNQWALQVAGKSSGWLAKNQLQGSLQIGAEAQPWLEGNQVDGHFTCLSSRVFLLEQWASQATPLKAGHYITLQNAQGQSFQVPLPFEPKAAEVSVLECLARYGRVSEAELAKVAKTRRVGGLVEALREKLGSAQLKWIATEGQGRDGLIYSWTGPEG